MTGLALVEAVFMPARDWHAQTTLLQQSLFWMFESGAVGRHLTTRTGLLYRMVLEMGTERSLSDVERETYLAPYAAGAEPGASDAAERRRVVLDGSGPATILDGDLDAPSPEHADHIAGVINRTARVLAGLGDVPVLLVHAEPGLISNAPALAYAREHFEPLTVARVEAGHFVPEDQPAKLGDTLLAWYRASILSPAHRSLP